MDRQYDMVIYGASGFTGQFVVEELARVVGTTGELKWAVSGRNETKLRNTLKEASRITGVELEGVIDVLVADVAAADKLAEVCRQSKVVLNCVGPYRFWGEPVVKACVENGCNYVDISGEPEFLERMVLEYNARAEAAGVYIIGACGFDSIPCVMGYKFTKDSFPGQLSYMESYISTHSGPKGSAVHFATWQSAVHGFGSQQSLSKIRKSLGYSRLPVVGARMPKRGQLFYSNDAMKWCIPFPGADVSVCKNGQRVMDKHFQIKPIQYGQYIAVPSLLSMCMLLFFGAIFTVLAKFASGRSLLEKYPALFSAGYFTHEGPTRDQVAETSATLTFYGRGHSEGTDPEGGAKPNLKIVTDVNVPEPGYVCTPICLVQCALILLQERDSLPGAGGVLPPGGAFEKSTLVDRLMKRGLKFNVIKTEAK